VDSKPSATKPPSDGPDLDAIEREIKALSTEYMRELPERFEFLKRQVQDLKLGRGEASTAKNEAHKIKGTASSYGAHEIGKLAVVIDDCLRKVDANASACDAALWKTLEDAIDEALRVSQESVDQSNSEAAVPAVYSERQALSSLGLSCGRGHNIVIVDDDPDFTKRVSLVLGYEDMLVYSFNDAKNLSAVLADLSPDLLILDLNMPDVDGFEVCKRIRLDSRWRNLPIVFLTAQTGWETRVAAFDAGADDYIPKPVVNQELIARIRFRAEKSRLQEQVQSQTSINQLLWRAMYMLLVQSQATSRQEGLSSSGKSG
jgi:PleD family two-component response regulator